MFTKKILVTIMLAATACHNIYAKPLHNKRADFDAPIEATLILNSNVTTPHSLQASNTPVVKKKTVHLMNRHLTSAQRLALTEAIQLQSTTSNEKTSSSLPARVKLGMNNLEVLDQGWYGTCPTFAVTAAMDALLQKGNYVSQLCLLQLSDILESQGYVASEWRGGYADDVLGYFHEFGIVSTEQQKLNGCGGLKDYPLHEITFEKNTLTLPDYYNMSENFSNNLFWYSLLTTNQHLLWSRLDTQEPKRILNEVKTVLAKPDAKTKYRVVFGVDLPAEFCPVGACGQYNAKNDTWVLSRNIRQAGSNIIFGGHEMVITGYDDTATAVDNDGKKHTGLLIIRNSWGPEVGDHGDYYMSYDFFKALVNEVFVIGYEPDEE